MLKGKTLQVTGFRTFGFESNEEKTRPGFKICGQAEPVHSAKNCEVGDWGAFGACSVSCGEGTQERTREKTVVEANGGTCDLALTESRACNEGPCVDCGVAIDSFRGSPQFARGCSGAVWSKGGKSWEICTAQKKQNTAGVPDESLQWYKTCCYWGGFGQGCKARKDTAPSCLQADYAANWGEWGECSVSCGGGDQSRDRKVPIGCPSGGSVLEKDTRPCNVDACASAAVDCVGAWEVCDESCGDVKFSITTPAENGGTECTASDGDMRACAAGEGACTTISSMEELQAWCNLSVGNCRTCKGKDVVTDGVSSCKVKKNKVRKCKIFSKKPDVCDRISGCKSSTKTKKGKVKKTKCDGGKMQF